MEIKKIKKVIIPCAGWGTRFLPYTKSTPKELLPILNKPALDYLVDEAIQSGIEEIILITSFRKKDIVKYFSVDQSLQNELRVKGKKELLKIVKETNKEALISIVIQEEQLGLGHALACAYDYIDDEPFAVILGDDLIYSEKPAIKQLIDFYYETNGANILGVQSVPNKDVNKYGIVVPKNNDEKENNYFEIKDAVEKPHINEAPSNKAILGRYVFNPRILDYLKNTKPTVNGEIQVVDAFKRVMKYEKIFAYEFQGTRYDLGSISGFVKANIDYALKNNEISGEIYNHINKILEDKKC